MSEQGDRPTEPTAGQIAAADGVLAGGDPQLVAVCGLPGVGKSTVAERITERVDGRRFRTDAIRKELFEEPEYTAEEKRTVYGELLARAKAALREGEAVVLDATFADAVHRDHVRELARDREIPVQFVRVVCEPAVVERRIAAREDISDADVDIYRQFKGSFDSFESEPTIIDNSGSEAKTRAQVDELF